MTHDLVWKIGPFTDAGFKDLGRDGVFFFFAISGILICTRILEEEELAGHFRIRSFYIRRLFRIQPAALVYLFIILALMVMGIVHVSWSYWRGALLLYENFLYRSSDHSGQILFTGHFWSLAVEEHFYVLLSLLLFFLRKRRIAVFGGLILVCAIGSKIVRHLGYYSPDTSPQRTYWVILYLLVPAFLAILIRLPTIRSLALRWLHPWVAYLLVYATMMAARLANHPDGGLFSLADMINNQAPLLFFGFSLWVIGTMLHPRSWSTRFLELPFMRWLGRLSYSIYLWHILFFSPANPEAGITSPVLLFLSGRPWKYIATLLAAMMSYYWIEKPLIRLGHRLAPPMTPGHKDLAIDRQEALQP